MSDTIYVDNTILRTVARCDTQAVMRHVYGYVSPDERPELVSGKMAHTALAAYFKGYPNILPSTVLAVYAQDYQAWANEHVPSDERLSYDNTSKILSYWLAANPYHKLPFAVSPANVEIGFRLPLLPDESIVYVGRIDAIANDERDSVRVLDHKFTGKISSTWLSQWRVDSGLTGYVWALQQKGEKVSGVYVNAIEFSRLPTADRRCKEHGVKYPECQAFHAKWAFEGSLRTPEQVDQWRLTAIKLAYKYAELRAGFTRSEDVKVALTQGQFTGSCAWCPYYNFCAADKPVHMLDTMYAVEPWEPFEGAFKEAEK